MAGIYLHIPFCKKACHYCNFHFSTSLQLKNEFIDALLKEIQLQQDFLQDQPVQSIYFGGGTPSILAETEIREILETLSRHYVVSPTAEITLEANPDDIQAGKVSAWRDSGINRLSIGIQSFYPEHLRWMNRAHSAEQAMECIPVAQDAGIDNLTIDLIYGIPGLTDAQWASNVRQAIAFDVAHLSCYALTVEPKTALEALIRKKALADTNPEDQARQFLLLTEWLEQAGYEQYEISNFAKPGFRSRHNSSYWQGVPYLGLGPSAHSYAKGKRQWNIASNIRYIESIKAGRIPFEEELLTASQQYNEYIMTALRTLEGISFAEVSRRFGLNRSAALLRQLQAYPPGEHLNLLESSVTLTREGRLFADGIAAGLFVSEGEW